MVITEVAGKSALLFYLWLQDGNCRMVARIEDLGMLSISYRQTFH